MKIVSSINKQINFVVVVDLATNFFLAADQFIEAELDQFALINI